ncbi:MAG: DUF2911 domain-containing protein [Vicinamibacterales bacterium]|jgi:hypothetical protein|nr:DUF2911 domain-containing protein [Vicinamibacterales bacterium]HIN10458.1 DUF2911 domain-containing protein [Acidobacteriota bacterium]
MTRARLLFTLGAICLVAMSARLSAQERRIMSPAGGSATQIGGYYDPVRGFVNGDWIEVRYGRPLKRGRDIFGADDYREHLNDGAPIWRAGANQTTRLITDVPLVFATTAIAPGEYTLFIDLGATPWEFIVSSWPAQVSYDAGNREALFGAFEYTPDRDVVRIPMTVETLPRSFDQLSWQFLDITDTGGTLALLWDTKLASVAFTLGT